MFHVKQSNPALWTKAEDVSCETTLRRIQANWFHVKPKYRPREALADGRGNKKAPCGALLLRDFELSQPGAKGPSLGHHRVGALLPELVEEVVMRHQFLFPLHCIE